jgi:glycosyltransferase involved in cell wall biosynthesis
MRFRPRPSIGFVSTFRPTVCGIASYTGSLASAVSEHSGFSPNVGVISLSDRPTGIPEPPVVFTHRSDDAASLQTAKRWLDTYDVVSIQHEFGIFGGPDGEEVLELVSGLSAPSVITFHTVLDDPSPNQRRIVEGLSEMAERVVVMSQTASKRLSEGYRVHPDRIEVIPHGADDRFAGPSLASQTRPLALTWGLIGPGKGLETAIEAFAGLVDLEPLPRYMIAGATHPNVRRTSGEAYRGGLIDLVERLGVGELVEFEDRFYDREALTLLVRGADLVVLPYSSRQQVTSGVLVEAMAASKPVVATAFPHAVELLSDGAGLIVAHDDPVALGDAVRRVLTDPVLMRSMSERAGALANEWYWPGVGRRFGEVVLGVAESAMDAAIGAEVRHVAG